MSRVLENVPKLRDYENALVLEPHHCNYAWLTNGSRWQFADNTFMRKREQIGIHTHLIHFHTKFIIEEVNGRQFLHHKPIIVFKERNDLVHFRLIL